MGRQAFARSTVTATTRHMSSILTATTRGGLQRRALTLANAGQAGGVPSGLKINLPLSPESDQAAQFARRQFEMGSRCRETCSRAPKCLPPCGARSSTLRLNRATNLALSDQQRRSRTSSNEHEATRSPGVTPERGATQRYGRRIHRSCGHRWRFAIRKNGHTPLQRMDNVGIVVDDLPATIAFFRELGLELEGQATIEGDWAERVTGLRQMRVEIAMMRTPDGHSRLEISRFLTPPTVADHRNAPVNALGYLRIMFAVDDIDDTLARLRTHGAQLVSSEVVQYEDAYRLCYIRGPEGLLIGLAQELG